MIQFVVRGGVQVIVDRRALLNKIYPLLKRVNRNVSVRTEVVKNAKELNNIEPHVSIGFLNGTIDYNSIDNDELVQLTTLLCKACEAANIPHNVQVGDYVSEDIVSATTTYNKIVLKNVCQINTQCYTIRASGTDIYKLYYEDYFDLSYLSSIPELHLKLSDPDNIMTAKQEMEVNKLATDISNNMQVPIMIQLNVSPMQNDQIIYDDEGTLTVIDNELEIVDPASLYNIYAVTKMASESKRADLQVVIILYTLDALQINAYRNMAFTGEMANAAYLKRRDINDPILSSIEKLINLPSMDKIIGRTGDKPIKAYELSYYFKKYFLKKDLDHIVELFYQVLQYFIEHPTGWSQKSWGYRRTVILCRTIDKADEKGITDPSLIANSMIKIVAVQQLLNSVGRVYKHIGATAFKKVDSELEVLLCTTQK